MSKKILILSVVVVFMVVMSSQSFANGTALSTPGSRAVSLAGAYRALSNDWSGGYWNPAGLTQVKGWNIGANLSFITANGTLTPALYEDHRFNGYADGEAKNVPKTYFIPTLGFVHSLESGFSYGLGIFIPFGLGAKWDLFNPVPGYGCEADFPKYDHDSDLKVIDTRLSLAYKLTDDLSAGLAIGVLYNMITITQPALSKPFAGSPLEPLAKAPHDYIVAMKTLEGSGISFGANFGLQYKLSEKLTLGAALRYYTDAKLDGSVKTDAYYPSDPTTDATIDALHTAGRMSDEEYAKADKVFEGQKVRVVDDSDVKATMPLPMNIGGGIAFRPTNNLLLSFDVEWTQWSTWDKIPIENLEYTTGEVIEDAKLVENWDDGMRYNLGIEHTAWKTEDKTLDLRFGYYYDTSPIPDETIGPSIPDINAKHSFIVGAGFTFGKFQLNGLFSYFSIPDRDVTEWKLGEDFGNENLAGKYSMGVTEFHIGVEYNF